MPRDDAPPRPRGPAPGRRARRPDGGRTGRPEYGAGPSHPHHPGGGAKGVTAAPASQAPRPVPRHLAGPGAGRRLLGSLVPEPEHGGPGVVAGAFLVLMVGFGAIYSYAAFAEEIRHAFSADPASVTLIYALSGGSCFLVSAVSGPLADRLDTRMLAGLGMMLVGAGLATAAAARDLSGVYLGYGLLTGIGTGCAYVPAMTAVQRCFLLHRGLASGIAVSGVGLGTALVPPMAALLADWGDWRTAFMVSGALAAAVGVGGALLLTSPPVPSAAGRQQASPRPRLRDFALAYVGVLLLGVPAVLPQASLVGTAQDLGLGHRQALMLLGLIGIGTVLGRFVLAALADALGRRAVFLACCAGMSASMLLWALARDEAGLRVFALGFGALQGGLVALLPAYVADSFGLGRLGGVMGALYTSRGVALLAAPPGLAFAMAAMAGHAVPLAVVAVLGLLGTLALARMRRAM
ncbi:MFS transporter [Siccirubricoccus phaeus]|uniref:MFS transporter n=1 Tax=Siccirubricoccus phaeus TaxID=2595053 RepID=UPI0011F19F1B|nr:MFS transporter [Siccirubricoccus phaeus]